MTPQGILFLLGILLLIAAAICAGIAAYLYFTKDIKGIRDDLSGKKRAKAIAEMDEEAPANRRRQRAAAAPASAAAAAAASAMRNAPAVDMDDVQATAAPKAKPQPRHASGASAGSQGGPGDGPHAAQAQPADDAAETVVTGNDAATTVVAPNVGGEQSGVTMVAGLDDAPKASGEADQAVGSGTPGRIRFDVVRKIVLAESPDFIEIR